MPREIHLKASDFTGQAFYVGIDVHLRSWTVAVRTMGLQVAHFTQAPRAGSTETRVKEFGCPSAGTPPAPCGSRTAYSVPRVAFSYTWLSECPSCPFVT